MSTPAETVKEVRAYLESNKLSQRAFSRKAGVDQSYLGRLLKAEFLPRKMTRVMQNLARAMHFGGEGTIEELPTLVHQLCQEDTRAASLVREILVATLKLKKLTPSSAVEGLQGKGARASGHQATTRNSP